jgi:hypothetical protein
MADYSKGKDNPLEGLDLSSEAGAEQTRRVYIGCPTYERHENEVLSSIYQWGRNVPANDNRYFLCTVPAKGQSLLAKAFNDHWAACLNDGTFDYWLLNHGDLAPDPNVPYVHVMVEEMIKHDLDVLSCVAALKDDRGLTSTAVGCRSNMWTMRRRISQHELELLPETFTYEDCMEKLDWSRPHPLVDVFARGDVREPCLLVNTGMMMVRLTKGEGEDKVRQTWPYCFPGFMIWDRLGWVHPDGTGTLASPARTPSQWGHYRIPEGAREKGGTLNVQCVPEDWYFSIWCAREELRVGATTKVPTDHWGFGKVSCRRGQPLGTEKIDHAYFDCEARH